MKTTARIRRPVTEEAEVVVPVNVSRGGFSFESRLPYRLHEIIYVALHYHEGGAVLERLARIVRVSRSGDKSEYGVAFPAGR